MNVIIKEAKVKERVIITQGPLDGQSKLFSFVSGIFTDGKITKNFRELLEFLKNFSERKIESFLKVLYSEEEQKFVFFASDNFSEMSKKLLIFHPESEEVLAVAKGILEITEELELRGFVYNKDNYFNPLGRMEIINLLFTNAGIKARGEEPFKSFRKKSKNGKIREIIAPHEEIKASLREINKVLQNTYDKRNESFQVAYKKGKSILSGARIHKDKKYVVDLDIHDFFPSCKREMMEKYLKFLFISAFNSEFLENEFYSIILRNGALFLGSPVSGTIANVILSPAVKYMEKIAKKKSYKLSVYADDITISSDSSLKKKSIAKLFSFCMTPYNLEQSFKLNEKKTKAFSNNRRKVTGVSINNNNEITVNKNFYRSLRTYLEHLANKGSAGIPIEVLRGKIAYALMLDESGKIKNYLNKFKTTVLQYHLCKASRLV